MAFERARLFAAKCRLTNTYRSTDELVKDSRIFTIVSAAVVILLSTTSCTNSSGGGGSSTGTTWTSEQISSANSNCSATVQKTNESVQPSDAILMCACVIENASKKWSYDDFVANEFTYTETMNKEGVFNTCKERMIAQTTGTKWTTSQVFTANNNCSLSARNSNSNISFIQASNVCSCLFNEVFSYG